MGKIQVVKAPNSYDSGGKPIIFLSGSIEMGTAEHWQDRVVKALEDYDVLILNPRRDDWDSSWKQSADDIRFFTQVKWELQGIRDADIVIMYFDPTTKSPITLLELGLILGEQPEKLRMCCPDGFWRQGNVAITTGIYSDGCDKPTHFESLEGLLECVKEELK